MTDDELDRLWGSLRGGRSMFYDRQGQPMTARQYEDACEENWERNHRVGQDIVIVDDEPVRVSTVWLGIDHNWGPPIIFETMLFGHARSGEYGDNACARYATELDAQEGHVRTVADLAAGRVPWFMRYDMEDADDAAD